MNTLLKSIAAGILISVGGTAFLVSESKVVGAALFCIGLFFILLFNFNLFTGKVGYLVNNKPSYLKDLGIILSGNFIGTISSALILRLTKIDFSRVNDIVASKLNDSPISILILSIFCGMLMFLGVNGYKTCQDSMGKNLSVIFAVMVFILCGFEHCVANMFYFTLANVWFTLQAWAYMLIMIVGNSIGALLISGIITCSNKIDTKKL